MAKTSTKPKLLFHTGHYNILAAQIKKQLEKYDDSTLTKPLNASDGYIIMGRRAIRGALSRTAIDLAKRLLEDNPEFDIKRFLDACSLNPDLYPLHQAYEYLEAHGVLHLR